MGELCNRVGWEDYVVDVNNLPKAKIKYEIGQVRGERGSFLDVCKST